MTFQSRAKLAVLFLLLAVGITAVLGDYPPRAGKVTKSAHVSSSVSSLSLEALDEQLQECAVVQALSASKVAAHAGTTSSLVARLFEILFPGSPAVNALLATLYISGPPNLLLALCPPNVDPSSLSIMVAFAVGGLMGDTLFHLLPEIFVGEDDPDRARFLLVEPNRNFLLGAAILVGFMTFVAMDKSLRIATAGVGGHDHSHAHTHGDVIVGAIGSSSAMDIKQAKGMLTKRTKSTENIQVSPNSPANVVAGVDRDEKRINSSVKLSGYLNLIADFTHNITDGLAMSASFYASPTIGATTTMAVFFHEIPHEVGDFALLVQSGFSKRAAMGAQFITALGALLGTGIGIILQEYSGSAANAETTMDGGLWGTSLKWGDMLLPFTAGTFLYVGTVAVIPELLETGPNKMAELRKTLSQFAAIAVGAGIMLYISWH